MKIPAPKCERCGFKQGQVRSGKIQPETLSYLQQGKLNLLLCGKCRAQLSKLKPIPRA